MFAGKGSDINKAIIKVYKLPKTKLRKSFTTSSRLSFTLNIQNKAHTIELPVANKTPRGF